MRPDIVYGDSGGNIFPNAAADRMATVNTPDGGLSRATRRPDIVPGVDPIIQDGGLAHHRPVDPVAGEVAERARLRRGERRRVDVEQPAVLDDRVHARDEVGPPRGAREAAAGRVDHRRAVRRRVQEHGARRHRRRRCRDA